MSGHTGAVNCVRFASSAPPQTPASTVLASAGDDNVVLLWHETPRWQSYACLRITSSPIDLAWSHRLLAVGCVDGTISVWEDRRCIWMLNASTMVKGIALNNRVLLAQTSSGTVEGWLTTEKPQPIDVWIDRKPQKDTSFFRRPSWCPCGKHCALVHVSPLNRKQRTLILSFDQQQFTPFASVLGPGEPVVCARFAPQSSSSVCLCATGSQSGVVCIIAITDKRAKAIRMVETRLTLGIQDVCWTPDGMHVLACSHGGGVESIAVDIQPASKHRRVV